MNTYLNIVGWKASEEAEAALELDSAGAETGGIKLGRAEGGGTWDNRLPSPSATRNLLFSHSSLANKALRIIIVTSH